MLDAVALALLALVPALPVGPARSVGALAMGADATARAIAGASDPHQDPAPAPAPASAHLTGRAVDAEGRPLAGVRFELVASRRDARDPLPEAWRAPRVRVTGDDGALDLVVEPPADARLTLTAALEGRVTLTWRWESGGLVGENALGDVRLVPPSRIVGHLVDAEGEVLVEGWTVHARPELFLASAFDPPSASASVDPGTGTFALEGLLPGRLVLSASGPGGRRVENRVVELELGGTLDQVLEVTAPDPARALSATLRSSLFHGLQPAPGRLVAIATDGARTPLVPDPRNARLWRADDLAPGLYAVELDDPAFAPWREDDVPLGGQVQVPLHGSAALTVRVLDPTGAPVTDATLLATLPAWRARPNRTTLAGPDRPAREDRTYGGLVPGDWVLEAIDAEGRRGRLEVAGLGPGETRAVEVRVREGVPLEGRVVDSEGRPLEGIEVHATWGDVPGWNPEHRGSAHTSLKIDGEYRNVEVGPWDRSAHTDADGRFRLEHLSPGPYTLCAVDARWISAHRRLVLTGDADVQPDLVLPRRGDLDVRLTIPPGTATESWTVSAEPLPRPSDLQRLSAMIHRTGPSPFERTTRLEDLPEGRARVQVAWTLDDPLALGRVALHAVDVDVVPGTCTELPIDLGAHAPVPGRVRVTVEPPLPGNARLSAFLLRDVPGGEPLRLEPVDRRDPEGARYSAVLPGTYRIGVRCDARGWTTVLPEPVEVAPGAPFEETVVVRTRPVTLVVRDAEGRPWSDATLVLGSEGATWSRAQVHVDAAGRAELRLPPGALLLSDPGPVDLAVRGLDAEELAAGTRFEVPGGPDPLTVEVVLPRGPR